MKDTLIINEQDNVAVRLTEAEGIPAGHKYALCDIAEGAPVIKYGCVIGRAKQEIKKGEWAAKSHHQYRSHRIHSQ